MSEWPKATETREHAYASFFDVRKRVGVRVSECARANFGENEQDLAKKEHFVRA